MRKSSFSARSCIFCGEPPSEKTKEHFIARWLSQFAGNDEKPANIIDADGLPVKRRWSSLTLPVCRTCNSNYGEFEEMAKPAFSRLSDGRVKASDTQIFFDYLDKLRVSFWLWRLYWCKKHHTINPNFHVDSRIAAHDRILLVARYPTDDVSGINPLGYDTMLFLRCPTVFGIFVKNTFLLSISSAALVTDYFQMTARVEQEFRNTGQVSRRLTGSFKYNPLERLFRLRGLVFFNLGNHTELPTNNFGSHIYLDEGNSARRVRACEEFEIPRMSSHRRSAHTLAQLNVHELQLDSLDEFYHLAVPNSEKLTTEKCKDELVALIRGDHLILDSIHPLILPRRKFLELD